MHSLLYQLGSIPGLHYLFSLPPLGFALMLFLLGFGVSILLRAWPERALRRQYRLSEMVDFAVLSPLVGYFAFQAACAMPYSGKQWYHSSSIQWTLLGYCLLVSVGQTWLNLRRGRYGAGEAISTSHVWSRLISAVGGYWLIMAQAAVVTYVVQHPSWDSSWGRPLIGMGVMFILSLLVYLLDWRLTRKGRFPRRLYGEQSTPLGRVYFRSPRNLDDQLFRSAPRDE